MVSPSTGFIMNDHLRLFNSFKTLPNAIAKKKRPLNWYTPIMLLSKDPRTPVLVISASGYGEKNVQTVCNIMFKYYIQKKFSYDPTIHHMVNKYRKFYSYYDVQSFLNGKIKGDFITTRIDFENEGRQRFFIKDLKNSASLFKPIFRFKIVNGSKIPTVSAIFLGGVPEPIIVKDARFSLV